MRTSILFILSLFAINNLFSQVAIVKDKEGFVNVRSEPSFQSKIIDTLSWGRIVYCFEAEGEWIPVDYNRKNELSGSGYIHKSRIQFLSTYKELKSRINHNSMVLNRDTINVILKSSTFNTRGRKLEYDETDTGYTYLSKIDGKEIFGTDGGIPKIEYTSIQIKFGKHSYFVPKNFIDDVFEPNFDLTQAYYDPAKKVIYLEAINSDGAGGYVVLWIFNKSQAIAREEFIPF